MVFLRVDGHDEERFRLAADVEALALPDGVVHYALVLAEHLPVHVHEVAWNVVRFVEQHGIVPAFQEVHALLLGGEIDPADLFCKFLDFCLRHAAQREDDRGELLCGKAREEVRLVLAVVERRVQEGFVGILEFEAGVVPGGEVVEGDSHAACRHVERAEFDVLVAAHARVRRAARAVFGAEIVEHLALVFFGNADNVMRDTETVGYRLCFGDACVFARAEAALAAFHVRHVDVLRS